MLRQDCLSTDLALLTPYLNSDNNGSSGAYMDSPRWDLVGKCCCEELGFSQANICEWSQYSPSECFLRPCDFILYLLALYLPAPAPSILPFFSPSLGLGLSLSLSVCTPPPLSLSLSIRRVILMCLFCSILISLSLYLSLHTPTSFGHGHSPYLLRPPSTLFPAYFTSICCVPRLLHLFCYTSTPPSSNANRLTNARMRTRSIRSGCTVRNSAPDNGPSERASPPTAIDPDQEEEEKEEEPPFLSLPAGPEGERLVRANRWDLQVTLPPQLVLTPRPLSFPSRNTVFTRMDKGVALWRVDVPRRHVFSSGLFDVVCVHSRRFESQSRRMLPPGS